MTIIKTRAGLTPLLWLSLLLLFGSSSLNAAANFEAKITKISVKNKMLTGRSYYAKVTVLNTGTSPWTAANDLKLVTTDDIQTLWQSPTGTLANDDQIQPGSSKIFNIKVTAPDRTGIYGIQFQFQRTGNTISSNSKTKMIVVENRANRVKFISQLLPEKMETGKKYVVAVQFRNNGSAIWNRKKGYKLGLKSKPEIWKESIIKMRKNTVVTLSEAVTFQFDLTAPDKPGRYPIQWRMKKGNKWFGEPTPKLYVEVTEPKSDSGAEFIYQNVPGMQQLGEIFTVLERGEIYPVSITFKNTTNKNWTPGRVALGAQNPPGSMTWSVDRIDLKRGETIRPSEIKSFSFKIIAPLQPGIYNFQWQMLKGFNGWIGEKSENISITVK